MKQKTYELIIIGSGPAGLTAAIYAVRAGIKTLIIEKGAPGGKLLNTFQIDNYPGVPFVSGAELAMKMYEQAKDLGVESIVDEVVEIKNYDKDLKTVVLKSGESLSTKGIIIATGLVPRKLNISNFDKYFGKGISTCVVCDGGFYKNKPIAIIGGGNSACEESLYISKVVSKIYLINNSDKLNAEAITIDKLQKLKNVEIFNHSSVLNLLEKNDKLVGLKIEDLKTKKTKDLNLEGVFLYIGHIPQTSSFEKLDILTKEGFIKVDKSTLETKHKGIYGVGDVIDKDVRQITTAVSDGTIAFIHFKKYLESNK